MPTAAPKPDISRHDHNNFDFLRFFLAALVLVYHSFPLLWLHTARMATPIQEFMAFLGYSAVDGFFILSGFLVTNSWVAGPRALDFLRKRVLRIYPAFIVASLFCAFILGPFCAPDASAYLHQFPKSGFIVHALLLDSPDIPPVLLHVPYAGEINGSCWTLRYEFICYLFVLTAGLLNVIKSRQVILGLYAAMAAAYIVQITGIHTIFHPHYMRLIGDPHSWIRLSCCYLAGMTAYLYKDKITYSRAAGIGAFVLLAVAYAFNYRYAHAIFPIAGAYMLLVFAFDKNIPLAHWAKNGDFSYGTYLYAFPVQQFFIMTAGAYLNPVTLTLLAFPFTLGLAYLSWHVMEKPALRLKPKSKTQAVKAQGDVDETPAPQNVEPPSAPAAVQIALPFEPES